MKIIFTDSGPENYKKKPREMKHQFHKIFPMKLKHYSQKIETIQKKYLNKFISFYDKKKKKFCNYVAFQQNKLLFFSTYQYP